MLHAVAWQQINLCKKEQMQTTNHPVTAWKNDLWCPDCNAVHYTNAQASCDVGACKNAISVAYRLKAWSGVQVEQR